jgi:hypothetical protein
MSFQWIFDNAETISINRRPNVAQTITRGNRVRSTNLGGSTWRFDVKLPDGIRWSSIRGLIEGMESLDRYTAATVSMNNTGYNYLNGYQGTATNIVVSYDSDLAPTQLTLVSNSSTSSGDYVFKSGDWLKLGTNGKTYSVVSDVLHGASSITVNRPVLETANPAVTYTALVGQNVSWSVIMTEMPSWTIFGYDQVSWSGNFVFYEVV